MLDALRQVSLFAQLTNEQFQWLSEHGCELCLVSGEYIAIEGEPLDYFYVLIEGEIEFTKKVGNAEKHVMSFGAGTYTGHELILLDAPHHLVNVRAVKPSYMLKWDTDTFWEMLTTCPSITRDLLIITAQRVQMLESMSQHHQKLIALGTLAAGLAHELNNPATAVVRGGKHLHKIFQQLPYLGLKLNHQQMTKEQLLFLDNLLHSVIVHAETPCDLEDLLAQSDREQEVTAWLDLHNVPDGWKIVSSLVRGGLDTQCLDTIVEHLPPESLTEVLAWLDATLTGIELLDEIDQSSGRISELVKAIKEYSYMDQAPMQEVDIHQGVESTLTILGHKLKGGISLTRDYDQSLPLISVYGSELNQVWTNLIDNAIDAMSGQGQIRIRTAQENKCVLVEIANNGPAIPPEIQERIFEPFFTTKGVGQGTGLGLVISYRIVEKHKGEIRLFSEPGNTRFQVILPISLAETISECHQCQFIPSDNTTMQFIHS
ncbi:ATPase [Nostoc sp. 'Peltigera membranacea cyanobiont' 210A]|uniref:ATP-binding protein n=1 Tax=Nostoc sp. 'Peltigera membranacea cyanobiont' 210A TaxID=2014529 RepID=UPI000B953297|nr:ATP-binding protein [Nostoc sp. 'Peltigera membranacea cyanobiont' 210A]OYD96352.1 ATPase [Nostoc sp. 'Peltigera membranacea cyanobiont' 210A]